MLGPAVRDLLLRFPNVVLWVNGHTHRNTVTPYARKKHAKVPGGFWEVNTAAHVDWPQQARTVELVDNRNGTLSIFGTIVDHVAPTSYGKHPKSPLELASLSRELGANDWQENAQAARTGRTGAADGSRTATSSSWCPRRSACSPQLLDRDLMRPWALPQTCPTRSPAPTGSSAP